MGKVNWSDHLVNIISVILGVTLAFVFDDIASSNFAKAEKNRLISDLILELESDLMTYSDYQIPSNRIQSNRISSLVDHMIQKEVSDTIGVLLESAIGINNHTPTGTVYKLFNQTSNLAYISTPELRADLVRFYDELAEEATARGEIQLQFYQSSVLPSVLEYLDFVNPDPGTLVNAPMKVRNQFLTYAMLVDSKTSHYEIILQEGNQLLENLKKEIEE